MISVELWRTTIGLFNKRKTLINKVAEKQYFIAIDRVLKYLWSIKYFIALVGILFLLFLTTANAGHAFPSKTNKLCSVISGKNSCGKNIAVLLKAVIEILLIIGGVESNPGPNGNLIIFASNIVVGQHINELIL